MPLYIYKAVTKNGEIIRNRVEEPNKYILMRKLKNNDLLPIEVISKTSKKRNFEKQKRNIETSNSILKTVRNREIERNINEKKGSKIKKALFTNLNAKITERDIVVFTENFYLLKKANFNNIHALSTVIETTENHSLKAIIEDILLGVEARRKYVCNNAILSRCIFTDIY